VTWASQMPAAAIRSETRAALSSRSTVIRVGSRFSRQYSRRDRDPAARRRPCTPTPSEMDSRSLRALIENRERTAREVLTLEWVDGTPLNGPSSLRKAMLDRQDVFIAAMTEKLMMYGVGRETKYYDMPAVRTVMRDAAKNRYRLSDLILGVVKSAPFQMKVKS